MCHAFLAPTLVALFSSASIAEEGGQIWLSRAINAASASADQAWQHGAACISQDFLPATKLAVGQMCAVTGATIQWTQGIAAPAVVDAANAAWDKSKEAGEAAAKWTRDTATPAVRDATLNTWQGIKEVSSTATTGTINYVKDHPKTTAAVVAAAAAAVAVVTVGAALPAETAIAGGVIGSEVALVEGSVVGAEVVAVEGAAAAVEAVEVAEVAELAEGSVASGGEAAVSATGKEAAKNLAKIAAVGEIAVARRSTFPLMATPTQGTLQLPAGSMSSAKLAPDLRTKYKYEYSESSIEAGKDFSQSQKAEILNQNKVRNGGVLRSDKSGKILEPSSKCESGVTPSSKEAQIDHMQPKSKGGPNSAENAQVLSREENIQKSDKVSE